jgi:cell division protein FtsL
MVANHITSVAGAGQAGAEQAGAGQAEKTAPQLKYSVFLFVAFVMMVVAITYVWSHVQMTKLEYQVAEEMTLKEQMLEEQRKLKLEYATLKSPQRIEAIAKSSLNLSYPEGDQVIIIRDTGAAR